MSGDGILGGITPPNHPSMTSTLSTTARRVRRLIAIGCPLLSATFGWLPQAVAQSAAPASPAEDQTQTITLGAYEVTGSHIKRLEGEGPAPINAYSSATIEQSGDLTLANFLQTLPFNSGSLQTINNPSGFGQGDYDRGASSLNPRGLGPQLVLVLIDGHRPVNFAAPDATGAAVFDIDSNPTAVVDSVDYLKDGASGIYGSDAITGVLNIKLKKSFSGISTDAMVGDVAQSHGNGGNPFARSENLIAGTSANGTSFLVDINWFKQTGNTIADYARSRSTDFLAFGVRGVNDSSTSTYPFSVSLPRRSGGNCWAFDRSWMVRRDRRDSSASSERVPIYFYR